MNSWKLRPICQKWSSMKQIIHRLRDKNLSLSVSLGCHYFSTTRNMCASPHCSSSCRFILTYRSRSADQRAGQCLNRYLDAGSLIDRLCYWCNSASALAWSPCATSLIEGFSRGVSTIRGHSSCVHWDPISLSMGRSSWRFCHLWYSRKQWSCDARPHQGLPQTQGGRSRLRGCSTTVGRGMFSLVHVLGTPTYPCNYWYLMHLVAMVKRASPSDREWTLFFRRLWFPQGRSAERLRCVFYTSNAVSAFCPMNCYRFWPRRIATTGRSLIASRFYRILKQRWNLPADCYFVGHSYMHLFDVSSCPIMGCRWVCCGKHCAVFRCSRHRLCGAWAAPR